MKRYDPTPTGEMSESPSGEFVKVSDIGYDLIKFLTADKRQVDHELNWSRTIDKSEDLTAAGKEEGCEWGEHMVALADPLLVNYIADCGDRILQAAFMRAISEEHAWMEENTKWHEETYQETITTRRLVFRDQEPEYFEDEDRDGETETT